MAARRRRIDDLAITDSACELLIERGAGALTFAEVGKRCGLAPPTLVQRFGTREGLLGTLPAALSRRVGEVFVRRDGSGPALLAVQQTLSELAQVQVAASLLAPSVDLQGYALELRRQISFALVRAIEAGELPRLDVAQLARTLQIVFAGAVATALLERCDPGAEVALAVGAQLAEYV